MPADLIVKTGDMIQITFTPPVIVPSAMPPVPLTGTSTDTNVSHMPVCLEGDELPIPLRAPLPYTSPPFVIPGMGTIKLTLGATNKTSTSKNGKAMLVKGTPFTSEFQVTVPAMQPAPPGPPIPDPVSKKPGTAQFITTNVTVNAD